MAKQTADLRPIETMLLQAREVAEEFGEVVLAYFIDMAISETRMKNPPLANVDNPLTCGELGASEKIRDKIDGPDSNC